MSRRDERGSITVWMALSSFVMIFLVGLAVDLGGQVHAHERAHDVAAQAARAGGEEVEGSSAIQGHDLAISPAAARAAAQRYLDAAGVAGTVTINDGTTITVTVTDSYDPQFLGLIGINRLDVTGTATARTRKPTRRRAARPRRTDGWGRERSGVAAAPSTARSPTPVRPSSGSCRAGFFRTLERTASPRRSPSDLRAMP